MKLLIKNGYTFAAGMFWQIPDEGKRRVNLARIVKDTKYTMFCQVKNIRPTWGFCYKNELQGVRKVVSLGKFIVESSNLTTDYSNSIICYKFKGIGELNENGKPLTADLYGYIVLLNETICPEEGEYVAEFEAIKESIIQKAKKHEIETLYLPLEVAEKFFTIFARLYAAYPSDELLMRIIQTICLTQYNSLKDFLTKNFNNTNYLNLLDNTLLLDVKLLRSLIKEPLFEKMVKDTNDKNIKYLIPNIISIPYTSDEIYWNNSKFKAKCNKALIQPIASIRKYKIGILGVLIGIISYTGYNSLFSKEIKNSFPLPSVTPTPVAVLPHKLITACLNKNDKYFKDLGTWTLSSLKCNSLEVNLKFTSDVDTTLGSFIRLTNNKKAVLEGRMGILSQPLHLPIALQPKINLEQIITNLQQAAIKYNFKLLISSKLKRKGVGSNPFTINSTLSPGFLFNHGVLNSVRLKEIDMSVDKSNGFYDWKIQGVV